MDYKVRTLRFIDWNSFLQNEKKDSVFTLDFQIDAGFSFTSAISGKELNKTKKHSVNLDLLNIPTPKLKFKGLLKIDDMDIHSIKIEKIHFHHDITERYQISVDFSNIKIDFNKFKKELNKKYNENKTEKETINMCYFCDYFEKQAEKIIDEFISFIALSGYFAKYTFSSLNLYLNDNGQFYRILQSGGGVETASNNPVRPGSLNCKNIINLQKKYKQLPENYKNHYKKGVHYKFLGFYDESFLCFYKIIESIFKSDEFSNLLIKSIFNSDNTKLSRLVKSSSQKTMMLFIYQWIVSSEKDGSEEEKQQCLNSLVEASKIRNAIAHSADQTEKSKKCLKFVIDLANIMINNTFLK